MYKVTLNIVFYLFYDYTEVGSFLYEFKGFNLALDTISKSRNLAMLNSISDTSYRKITISDMKINILYIIYSFETFYKKVSISPFSI
jgi:hypothetical protein